MCAYPVGMNVQEKRVGKVRRKYVFTLCRGPILALGWCCVGFVTGQCLEAV